MVGVTAPQTTTEPVQSPPPKRRGMSGTAKSMIISMVLVVLAVLGLFAPGRHRFMIGASVLGLAGLALALLAPRLTVMQTADGARTLWAAEEPIRFERLILALGARPVPLPDVEAGAEVHLLRSFADARRLVTSAGHARSAVVVGSGFIGCEAAASLALRGVETTLVTPDEVPQQRRLGRAAGERIAEWLTGAGVTLRTGVRVSGIEAPRTIHLDDGVTLAPDLILAAVGIEPGGGLLEGTELTVHEGRIVADEHLAAAPGVWVAGDVSRARHAVAGRPIVVEHWGDALAMGAAHLGVALPNTTGQPLCFARHTAKSRAW